MTDNTKTAPGGNGHERNETRIREEVKSRLDVAQQQDPVFVSSLPNWDLIPPMMPIKRVKRNL